MNPHTLKKINDIFTPSAPIVEPGHFVGREKEMERLLDAIITPGCHIVIFGDRGVGKTSLINVVKNTLDNYGIQKNIVSYTCCDSDSYENIVGSFLLDTNQLYQEDIKEIKKTKTGKTEGSISVIKGKISKATEESTTISPVVKFTVQPHGIATKYFSGNHLFIIDEFDRITSHETRSRFANIIKAASDNKAQTKIIILGVSNNAVELIGHHPSTVRCIKTIHVPRMRKNDIGYILKQGCNLLNISVTDEIIKLTIFASCGLPYFAHLLGAEMAKYSVKKNISHIDLSHFAILLKNALDGVIDIVKETFDDGIYQGENPDYSFGKSRSEESLYRELILLSSALFKRGLLENIADQANILLEEKKHSIPDDIVGKEKDNYVALYRSHDLFQQDIMTLIDGHNGGQCPSFLTINSDGSLEYLDPFIKGYALLRLCQFWGVNNLHKYIKENGLINHWS